MGEGWEEEPEKLEPAPEAREWHRPGMQDPFLGYLFQPGFLTISVIDSQEEGCVKDGCCPSLLVTLDLPFLPLHA